MLSGIFFDKRLFAYSTGSGTHVFKDTCNFIEPYFHIDNSLSKKRLFNLIKKLNLLKDLQITDLKKSKKNDLSLVHTTEYINKIKNMSTMGGGDAGFGTPFSKNAFDIAAISVGSLINLSEKVKGAKYVEIKNGKHLCNIECAKDFNKTVEQFVDQNYDEA